MYVEPLIARVVKDGMLREGWLRGDAAYINRKADRGGPTRGGITAKRWGQYRQLGRPATKAELLAITEDEALEFYVTDYVYGPKFDQVLDQRLRAFVVDWAFTSGPDDPWKAIQTSLRDRGVAPLVIDGAPGAKTFEALRSDRDPRAMFRSVFCARVRFYMDLAWDDDVQAFLAANDSTQLHNARGWVFRCLGCL